MRGAALLKRGLSETRPKRTRSPKRGVFKFVLSRGFVQLHKKISGKSYYSNPVIFLPAPGRRNAPPG
jgi:hypothetical protein